MGVALYIVRRVVRLVISLLCVSVITFALLQAAPGSFSDFSSFANNGATLNSGPVMHAITTLQHRYGPGIPVWKEYLNFMKGAVHLDFGPSYQYPQLSVQHIIAIAAPVSGLLALLGTGIALLIAIPVGVMAAMRQNKFLDHGLMFSVTSLQALPNYIAGLCLTLIFCSALHWLPVQGWNGPKNWILPALALGIAPAGILARYVRSSVLETLREDYVMTARAKGAPPFTLAVRHVLRNSLIPLVTVVGPLLASLMVGTVFVETIFGVPGMGLYFANAARARDMPLLMGGTLFFAAVVMVMNLLVDLSYGLLDPRTRTELGIKSGSARRRRPRRSEEGERWLSTSKV